MSEICTQPSLSTDNSSSKRMLNIFKSNKKRCSICHYDSEPGALEIHHIDGNHKNNVKENLLVLCTICHREAHAKQRSRKNSLLVDEIKIEVVDTNLKNCHHCNYTWEYHDKSEYYVTCPQCLRKIKRYS